MVIDDDGGTSASRRFTVKSLVVDGNLSKDPAYTGTINCVHAQAPSELLKIVNSTFDLISSDLTSAIGFKGSDNNAIVKGNTMIGHPSSLAIDVQTTGGLISLYETHNTYIGQTTPVFLSGTPPTTLLQEFNSHIV